MGTLDQWPIRRLTAEEAIRMFQEGILSEGEHVELLDGVLVEMTPQGPTHSSGLGDLADRLREAYGTRACVREDKPLLASVYSLPEPDIAVVRGRHRTYVKEHPTGADTLLVVELSLTSRALDRRKSAIYAAAGVPTYWIVDLEARRLELRATPEDGAYLVTKILREDEAVTLPELDLAWRVGDLLP